MRPSIAVRIVTLPDQFSRSQRHLERGQVPVVHRHEPAFAKRAAPAPVVEPQGSQQHPSPEIQLLAVFQQRHASFIEPIGVRQTNPPGQPVRQVDEILVPDDATGNLGLQAVVAAGEVGARIVDAIGHRSRRSAPCAEVTVSQRAQGFADALSGGSQSSNTSDHVEGVSSRGDSVMTGAVSGTASSQQGNGAHMGASRTRRI